MRGAYGGYIKRITPAGTHENYAGNKQKSYKIMITKIFAIFDKVKPGIESIRGLNLPAVKHTTVQVTRLS
jgi:hypothetical protein